MQIWGHIEGIQKWVCHLSFVQIHGLYFVSFKQYRYERQFEISEARVQTSTQLLPNCVTLGKCPSLSELSYFAGML